jgi:hypothetical protein
MLTFKQRRVRATVSKLLRLLEGSPQRRELKRPAFRETDYSAKREQSRKWMESRGITDVRPLISSREISEHLPIG